MPEAPSRSGLGLSIATLAAIFGTLIINSLSNFFPPGGRSVGEIANTTLGGVLITPANYAFAIWGVIYLGLIAYGGFQLRRDPDLRRVNLALIVACLAQMAWIYLFTLEQFWGSVVLMLVILGSLIDAYRHLQIGKIKVSRQRLWQAHIPFSVYLAWISVATIVNLASALYAAGWGGWGLSATAWTVLLLVIGAALAAIVIWQRRDLAFTLVYVWAYGAIALRHPDIPAIWQTALVGMLALLGLLAVRQTRPTIA
jgi:hypothetical protein